MTRRRIVVTGLGAIAPNGIGLDKFWEALIQGKSGINHIKQFDPQDHSVKIAGEVNDFNPEPMLEPRETRKLDRFSQFCLVATNEAIEHAGLDLTAIDLDRVGVILGTGVGGIQTLEEQLHVIFDRGPRRVSPHFVPKMIANIAAGQIAIRWGLKGPNQTIISACASGSDAIGLAMKLIMAGDVNVVITGGTESSITPLTIAGFSNMKALSTRNGSPEAASRPFDLDRDGFVLSEGAGILILEDLEHAQSRNANILAELVGYGSTNDAYHITQPAEGGEGAIKAMTKAILDAQVNPSKIDYINAHGTSTPFNDKNESAAIRKVFGEHADQLKISSTKSMTGHLLGASGAVEAIASIMAIRHGIIPPTINYTTQDPDCDLNYVPNQSIELPVNIAMSNSFGFGGHNAVLVFQSWKSDY
jgi:3-oxoacyl-[acyl-carrier-protein] synthase II